MSTAQARAAGDGSALPAASVALTENVWPPSARLAYDCGSVHGCQAPSSSLHSNDALPSGDQKLNTAEAEVTVPTGPAVISVSGGVRSIVQTCDAGEGSTFPALSRARTENVWGPSERLAYVFGSAHTSQAPASSLHSNEALPSPDENSNAAALEDSVPLGPPASEVSGAVVSTVHVRDVGSPCTLPAVSLART